MSFAPIRSSLDDALHRAGIKGEVEAARVIEEVTNILRKKFGADADTRMKPLYVRRRVLTVSCLSSAGAQELKQREREILKELNEAFPESVVDRLRFFA